MRGMAAVVSLSAAASAGALPPSGPASRMSALPLPQPRAGDPRKVRLGRDLFSDRRLSTSMRLSCASCHDLRTNGASSTARDRGHAGHVMRFNTPTVFNSVHNFRFGWEGRTRSLRDLASGTLQSDHLMGGGTLSMRRLAADRGMAARFRDIYGGMPDRQKVADALTGFMETLVTPNAPFDRWLRGDEAAMTSRQVRGYTRFQVLGCASCHQGANLGGNIFQRRGIFHPLGEAKPYYLRVPSLRNVAVTAPYFHDGSVRSLPLAIRQMARAQLDLTINDRDVGDISAFLNALTGDYHGRRVRPAATVAPQ